MRLVEAEHVPIESPQRVAADNALRGRIAHYFETSAFKKIRPIRSSERPRRRPRPGEPNYQSLLRAARPTPAEFQAQMVGSGGQRISPYFRWQKARASFGDARLAGKTRCKPDETLMDAAGFGHEWAICFAIDERPKPAFIRSLLALIVPIRGDGKRLADFAVGQHPWLFVDHIFGSPTSPRYRYRYMPEPKLPGRRVLSAEQELLSKRAIAESNKNDKMTPEPERRLSRDEELDLIRSIVLRSSLVERWPQTPIEIRLFMRQLVWLRRARNKIVVAHMWLVRKIARKYQARAELDDLVQAGCEGFVKALNAFNPELGNRLQTFARRQVERAIQDYLKSLKPLQRHGSIEALRDAGKEHVLGIYARNSVEREPEHKLIRAVFGKT